MYGRFVLVEVPSDCAGFEREKPEEEKDDLKEMCTQCDLIIRKNLNAKTPPSKLPGCICTDMPCKNQICVQIEEVRKKEEAMKKEIDRMKLEDNYSDVGIEKIKMEPIKIKGDDDKEVEYIRITGPILVMKESIPTDIVMDVKKKSATGKPTKRPMPATNTTIEAMKKLQKTRKTALASLEEELRPEKSTSFVDDDDAERQTSVDSKKASPQGTKSAPEFADDRSETSGYPKSALQSVPPVLQVSEEEKWLYEHDIDMPTPMALMVDPPHAIRVPTVPKETYEPPPKAASGK